MKDIKELKVGVIYHHKTYGSCKLSFDKQEDIWFDRDNTFYITPLNKPGYCLWSNIEDLEEFSNKLNNQQSIY